MTKRQDIWQIGTRTVVSHTTWMKWYCKSTAVEEMTSRSYSQIQHLATTVGEKYELKNKFYNKSFSMHHFLEWLTHTSK